MKMNKNLPFFIEISSSMESQRDELAHWHNSIELIEVLDGNYSCHVDNKTFLAQKGDLCIINKGRIHRVLDRAPSREEVCLKKSFIFNPEDIVKNSELYQEYVSPLLSEHAFSHMQLHSHKGIGREIFHLIDEIEDLAKKESDAHELEILGLLYMLIRRLFLVYDLKKKEGEEDFNSNNHLQRRMTNYIYEHFGEKLSLDDIANAGNISRSTCIRLFNEYTGKSPIDFLNSYRLEVSSQFLKDKKRRITDIAQECGFTQQSYYNRMFRKEFGLTPNEYRKQWQDFQ